MTLASQIPKNRELHDQRTPVDMISKQACKAKRALAIKVLENYKHEMQKHGNVNQEKHCHQGVKINRKPQQANTS